jgi:hypothetical protein
MGCVAGHLFWCVHLFPVMRGLTCEDAFMGKLLIYGNLWLIAALSALRCARILACKIDVAERVYVR